MADNEWKWLNCDSKNSQARYVHGLRPDSSVTKACKSALGKVVHVVHTHVKSEGVIAVHHIKTCGSMGKKTATRGTSDLDLVVFIEDMETTELAQKVPNILQEIRAALDRQYPGTRDEDWYQKFGLRYFIAGMEIDILIGCTNVKPKDFLKVQDKEQRAYMSASVSHYSTKFMMKQGQFFKDMVRMLKDWRDSYDNWPKNCKPKSYLLEVLMLHAMRKSLPRFFFSPGRNMVSWEPKTNNSRGYITTVLTSFFEMIGTVERYQGGKSYTKDTVSLLVFFDTYYREADIPWDQPEPLLQGSFKTKGKTKTRYATAVVLDPANPTNNLWLTLADANPFINRAKSTAELLRQTKS